jgi:hypothetical protein
MVLPQIQQLARQGLQMRLHLILHRGRAGGMVRVGGHDPRLIPCDFDR